MKVKAISLSLAALLAVTMLSGCNSRTPELHTVKNKPYAEDIALAHAGVTRQQVKFLRSEYELDDGTYQYDVEFHLGHLEYSYDIHAETGAILSFEKDD